MRPAIISLAILTGLAAIAVAGGLSAHPDRAGDPAAATIEARLAGAKPAAPAARRDDPGSVRAIWRPNQWLRQALPGRIKRSRFKPRFGGKAIRFEVRPGDVEPATGSGRAELSGPTFDEGDDIYVHDGIRVPRAASFRGPWQIVQQLHETDWGGSPGIAVFLDGDRRLRIAAGDGSPRFWRGPRLKPNRWYSLTYRVMLSGSSSAGFVEVWLNGVHRTVRGNRYRAVGQTIQTSRTYIKVGIYRSRSSTGRSVVEHSRVMVGTSLGAVLPD
ncbi:MAG: heparin lyase I family protein [Solirubrobacterales bacterium]